MIKETKKIINVMVVEDDLFTARLIKKYFEQKGIIVSVASDIGGAFHYLAEKKFDVVVLDLKLPSGNSVDWLAEIKHLSMCPILMYTSKDRVDIELRSLDEGADDFVAKDRGIDVLCKRILRLIPTEEVSASGEHNDSSIVMHSEYTFHPMNAKLSSETGQELALTKNEAKVLFLLLSKNGMVVSRDELSFVLKGYTYDGWTRSMDLCIFRLRKKLETFTELKIRIETIRGKGYSLKL